MNALQTSRERVTVAIEQLITLLDHLDGDCDLEPIMAGFDPNYMDDREGDDEREDELADLEPWLSTGADCWSIQGDRLGDIIDGEVDRTAPYEEDQTAVVPKTVWGRGR